MTEQTYCVAHSVRRETRSDGALILRSGHGLGPVVERTSDWLHHWAAQTPDAVLLAERSGAGWREVTYNEALQITRNLAAWLLDQGLAGQGPIAILSGNSVDHGLLTLAAQYAGLVTAPVAEQYSLIPGAHDRLVHVVDLIKPALLFTDDAAKYGEALMLPALAGIPVLTSHPKGAPRPVMAMTDATKGGAADVDTARAAVTPDTLGKILFTSGSTSHPKGVMTTHRMMCVNQTQLADAFPVLRARPPKILDWLPWNHVFGGSHNFNMMLANGGALYIDDGKPTDALFPRSLENMQMHTGTMAFNVPMGFARQVAALRADAKLRKRFFTGLEFTFYAGASLPQETWNALGDMAQEVTGKIPLMVSSWGMTETGPATLITHERINKSGIVGVPMTGTEIKLIPDDDRFEIRVKGPNIMPGYVNAAEKTAESFDEEGYLITGDAMKFVDPENPDRGLAFDGRISEDFKLTSGTWVRVASLRGQVLTALEGLANDVVITGADRAELGVLIFPATPQTGENGAVTDPAFIAKITAALAPLTAAATGSSTRITRAMVLADPPALAQHEVTAKGNLNTRKLLQNRAHLVERLYAGGQGSLALQGIAAL